MTDVNEQLYGRDLFGDIVKPKATGPITEQFIVPPFSVLDTRQGYWKERKNAWLATGIKGEVGRDALAYTTQHKLSDGSMMTNQTGTSIFDPVLCELSYRWFCPPQGQVVDPFAGGSVRGVIATLLGRRYWGCDLRPEQIAANEEQADLICDDLRPVWVCGDSTHELANAPMADLIFSCPPYGDLEVYSDLPGDISNMSLEFFGSAYRVIIDRAIAKLKPNRFACWVVGDYRSKFKGGYLNNFVSMTIEAFALAGAKLYNEAILATPAGSAPIRAAKQFNSGRKLVKTHQNYLVFCNGDPKIAAQQIVVEDE